MACRRWISWRATLRPQRNSLIQLQRQFAQQLHILRAVAWKHDDGVVGGDDDEVVDAGDADGWAFAAQEVVVGFERDGAAEAGIAAIVARGEAPDFVPRADVGPADVAGRHG